MKIKIKCENGPIQVTNKFIIVHKETKRPLQIGFDAPKTVVISNPEQGEMFLNARIKDWKDTFEIVPIYIAVFDDGIANILCIPRTITVTASWAFEFDAEDYDPKYIDIPGLAVDSAMRELKCELSNNALDAGDFKFTITEDSDNLLDLNKINKDEKEN